jgi:hypothetical protein
VLSANVRFRFELRNASFGTFGAVQRLRVQQVTPSASLC